MDMKILFLVISAALVCSQVPPAQNGQDKNACAQAGRNAVSRCFQSNGGFQMQFVIAVLSNGSQGSLPPNSDQIKKAICQGQSPIISCVFTSVNGLRTSDQCPSRNDFIRLEQETVGLITGLQTMCGSGPLPAPSPCMSELNNNMRHCYSQVGLNPDLFTPSGSQMTGAVIGENREISGKFCRNRVNLFECMRKTLDSCPGAREIMSLSGYDHDSLEKGIDVLCHDVNVYVKGLVCLQNPSPQVQACVETMVGKITDLTARQLQQPMPMDQFYNQFCQSRIQHMECDLSAWKGQCERDAIGLKNEFECNLLPSRCRRDATLQSKLQQTCAIQNFARELRSGATSSVLTSSLIISISLFSLALFL